VARFLHAGTNDAEAVTMPAYLTTTILPEIAEDPTNLWDITKFVTAAVGVCNSFYIAGLHIQMAE
jgi:hypothetical protein